MYDYSTQEAYRKELIDTKQYDIMAEKGGESMSLSDLILEFRAKNGLSQEEFANMVQVNVMTINAIENNKRKPLKTTAKKIEMFIKERENNVEG